jgi:hypothetical protein
MRSCRRLDGSRLNPRARSGERGVGLLEAAISTSLIVAILGMVYTTADVASSVNRWDAARLREEVTYREAFHRMREELMNSTMQKDPRTNLPRYSILAGPDGRQTLRFQKLAAARFEDGEIEAVWSTNIEYRVDSTGVLTRTQDGRTDLVGAGFESMTFAATERGSFKIVARTVQKSFKNGAPQTATHEMDIAPAN